MTKKYKDVCEAVEGELISWMRDGFSPAVIDSDYENKVIFVPQSHSSYLTVVTADGKADTIMMHNTDFEELAKVILKEVWL